jgi:tripartite-type tricarboxylate transporter receptor subunit TctC
MQRRDFLAGVAGLAGFGLSRPATAQSEPWPTRPIRLVVGFAAGGVTNIVGRLSASASGKASMSRTGPAPAAISPPPASPRPSRTATP